MHINIYLNYAYSTIVPILDQTVFRSLVKAKIYYITKYKQVMRTRYACHVRGMDV